MLPPNQGDQQKSMFADDLTFQPLIAKRWPDLVTLFGRNGAYSGCWCMFLRESSREFEANCPNGGAANKLLLEEIVREGPAPGLLAYRDDRPIGWVSVSPREDYPRVLRSPVHKPADDETGVWSIACFYIARDVRGQGVADALLRAAEQHARARGARVVEAYPTDTGTTRKQPAEMWRGSLSQFEQAGFEVVVRRKPARPIVRKMLR